MKRLTQGLGWFSHQKKNMLKKSIYSNLIKTIFYIYYDNILYCVLYGFSKGMQGIKTRAKDVRQ
jgi:hypothetical protein